MINIKDFEKLESPFVRELRANGDYIVIDKITEGYEWCFDNPEVIVEEKLHGTNVSVIIENGMVVAVYNRTERIPFINKGKRWIIEGILESFSRGYLDLLPDGQHFGELIGERVNGNPYEIKGHLWIPFSTYAKEHLAYKSWGKYPKDFQAISQWLEKDLMPLFWTMKHGMEKNQDGTYKGFVEGIIFVHPDGRRAKLRRDMFNWYKGKRHKDIITDEVIKLNEERENG